MCDLTRILDRAQEGDPAAAEELLPLVYEELRRLASKRMAQEKPGQTLQPTALVHEAWLRLAGSQQQWSGQTHFFGAAAEAMRRILIEQVRRKAAIKRGQPESLEDVRESELEMRAPAEEILAVHEALAALVREDPSAAEVVKLRYFVGMTIPEVAEALGISPRTADRQWSFARVWLKRAIRGPGLE